MAEPSTLEAADQRRQELTLEIQSIQAQLGDKQRTDETGRRLGAQEYWAWKKRAVHALNEKLAELRAIKNFIQRARSGSSEGDAVIHLHRLYRILLTMKTEDVDFDPVEVTQLEAAERCLRRLGINP